MKAFKFVVLTFMCCTQSCVTQIPKINGVSFVASRDSINEAHTQPLVDINANYAALMPFGFLRDLEHPEIIFNADRQWFGETREGVQQYAKALRKQQLQIMLKPQIWVRSGEFTGFIKMKEEADWVGLEQSYSKFILGQAELAQTIDAEIFCIGTELEQFISHRPKYWKTLIGEIKSVYKGKLTYAANWNEFENTPFWQQLDYIGINAYFPVSDSKTPTVKACLLGWEEHKLAIYEIGEKYNKSVLFTEYGYRSVDYSGKEPWKSDRNMTDLNLQAQVNTTQALFESFWDENWFAGGFLWKWHHNHTMAGGHTNTRFTPQNKPAENLIKREYGYE